MSQRKVAVLLAAAVLLIGCGERGGAPAAKGPKMDAALRPLVPDDTITLGGGQIEALLKSPLLSFAPGTSALMFDDFKKKYGIDPRQDLREFLFAHNGDDALLLVRGNIDGKALGQRLEQAGGVRAEHQGRVIYQPSANAAEGLMPLDGGVVALGKMARLRDVAALAAKGERALPAKLARLLEPIPAAAAQIWFVTAGGFLLNPPPGSNLANFDKVLSSLQDGAAWADLSRGLRLAALATCADADSAKRLQTQLRGLVGMARLTTPDDQMEMLRFYDAIQLEQKQQQLTLNLDVPTEMLERVRKQMERLGGGGAGR